MRKVLSCIVALTLTSVALSGGDDGRAIVNKAIKAAGGEKALAQFDSATWKEKGTYYGMGDGLPYTGVYAMQRPDKFRMEIEGVFILVFNGDKGWVQAGGKTTEMKKDQLAVETFNHKAGWIMSLVPLKDKAYKVTAQPATDKSDPNLIEVLVTRKDYPSVTLLFDKKTSLLAKASYRTKAADLEFKEVLMEYAFSDYRTVEGAKMSHKVALKRDGKIFVEAEHIDLKSAPKLEAKTFDRPAD